MEQLYKLGEWVTSMGDSNEPREVVEVLWEPNYGGWVYRTRTMLGITLRSSQTHLRPWAGLDDTQRHVCDCGGLKARTTHSHWCSLISR